MGQRSCWWLSVGGQSSVGPPCPLPHPWLGHTHLPTLTHPHPRPHLPTLGSGRAWEGAGQGAAATEVRQGPESVSPGCHNMGGLIQICSLPVWSQNSEIKVWGGSRSTPRPQSRGLSLPTLPAPGGSRHSSALRQPRPASLPIFPGLSSVSSLLTRTAVLGFRSPLLIQDSSSVSPNKVVFRGSEV